MPKVFAVDSNESLLEEHAYGNWNG